MKIKRIYIDITNIHRVYTRKYDDQNVFVIINNPSYNHVVYRHFYNRSEIMIRRDEYDKNYNLISENIVRF